MSLADNMIIDASLVALDNMIIVASLVALASTEFKKRESQNRLSEIEDIRRKLRIWRLTVQFDQSHVLGEDHSLK